MSVKSWKGMSPTAVAIRHAGVEYSAADRENPGLLVVGRLLAQQGQTRPSIHCQRQNAIFRKWVWSSVSHASTRRSAASVLAQATAVV